jgi:antitoxin YefM
MDSISAAEAGEKLPLLIGRTTEAHSPVLITGERGNAVLLSEEDWNAIQETLHLLSLPGMRESIREGMATPIEQCSREPGW